MIVDDEGAVEKDEARAYGTTSAAGGIGDEGQTIFG